MRWELHLPVQQIHPGLKADFLERPELEGDPEPHVTAGDKIQAELMPAGVWLCGIVQASTASELILDLGVERWTLDRRAEADGDAPAGPTVRTWWFDKKLYGSSVFPASI